MNYLGRGFFTQNKTWWIVLFNLVARFSLEKCGPFGALSQTISNDRKPFKTVSFTLTSETEVENKPCRNHPTNLSRLSSSPSATINISLSKL